MRQKTAQNKTSQNKARTVDEQMYAREGRKKKFLLNRGNLRGTIIYALILLSLLFPADEDYVRLTASLCLLLIGIGLHFIVTGQLIRDKVLCTEGAYALVRHPFYLANFIIDLSLCLLVGNVYLIILYPFLFFWAYGPSIRVEDRRLLEIYGPKFVAYEQTIPETFPSPLSIGGLRKIFLGFSFARVKPNESIRILRLLSVALILILIQDIRTEGISELLFPWYGSGPVDYDGVCLLAGIILLSASLVSIRILRRVRVIMAGRRTG